MASVGFSGVVMLRFDQVFELTNYLLLSAVYTILFVCNLHTHTHTHTCARICASRCARKRVYYACTNARECVRVIMCFSLGVCRGPCMCVRVCIY